MELKTRQIIEAWPALSYLNTGVLLPPRAAMQIGMAAKAAAPIFQTYDEQRFKLVEKFAKRADGEMVKVAGKENEVELEDKDGYKAGNDALLDAPVTIAVSQVKVDSLGDTPLPPYVLGALDWLIVAE